MRLRSVTFTGVDKGTDIDALKEISREFPFVEWGVLVSEQKSGRDNRYPGFYVLGQMHRANLRGAVHLCGRWAR